MKRFWILFAALAAAAALDAPAAERVLVPKPGLFRALTEPPCSYCATQHRSGFIRNDDRVVAWLRAAHNGGAAPLRHFLSANRVLNDTYGLFFYDPDGGYVSVFKKDYGYEFYGWRGGVMVARGRDGTLWSGLSGVAISGPQKGKRLERIPSLTTEWGYWLMLHPESTAYDMFDGKKYAVAPLPLEMSQEARRSMGKVDTRLQPLAPVLGVEAAGESRAYPLDGLKERTVLMDVIGGTSVAVFWYGPTKSAVAFRAEVDGRPLTFQVDAIAPETAPFRDRETGTRWSIAGRGIDGPLRGKELTWVNSVQCRWYAWALENPKTSIHAAP